MALPQTDSPPSFEFVPWYKWWKESTALGILSGMTVFAAEAVATIDVETCNKRKQFRFARLARPVIVGGVIGGVCNVVFISVINYLNEKRGVVDVHNFAASGAVAGAAFGLMGPAYPPGIRHRILSAMAFSVSGGLLSYPLGWACLDFEKRPRVRFDDIFKLIKEGYDIRKQIEEDYIRKQIKEGDSEQCDEAHMKDQEMV